LAYLRHSAFLVQEIVWNRGSLNSAPSKDSFREAKFRPLSQK
jgi:hypothetical protein